MRGPPKADPRALTISSTFSSVFFGASLAYLGSRVVEAVISYAEGRAGTDDWLVFLLSSLAFVKLVDSWWWYHNVLEKYWPKRGLFGWYADFSFALALFALMGFTVNFRPWCIAYALCNTVGCARIAFFGLKELKRPKLRKAVASLAVYGAAGAALFFILGLHPSGEQHLNYLLPLAVLGAGAHLIVTWRAHRLLRPGEDESASPVGMPRPAGVPASGFPASGGTEDIAVRRVKRAFATVYLTLTSIIQSAVLAYLAIQVAKHPSVLTGEQRLLVLVSCVVAVGVWNEYMMGSSAFEWVPRLWDSILPFLVGAAQFFSVHVATTPETDVRLWFGAMSLFYVAALLAFENMFRNAKMHRNEDILARMTHWPRTTLILTASLLLIHALSFWLLAVPGFSERWSPVAVGVALFSILAFLATRVHYWRRIVGRTAGGRWLDPHG